MKIAIVGSQNFYNYKFLKKYILERVKKEDIELVVSGGAKGADTMGKLFSEEVVGKKPLIFWPDWTKYGKAAGPIRNKLIVENSDVVFAFWDGHSPGTKSTIGFAEEMDKKLHLHIY